MTEKHVFDAELKKGDNLETFFSSSMVVVRTNFFRDRNFIQEMDEIVLPDIFKSISNRKTMMAWSAGSSEGRETYSMAMVIQRYIDQKRYSCDLKVRGSDINIQNIEKGKAGIYKLNNVELKQIQGFTDYYSYISENEIEINKAVRAKVDFYKEDLTAIKAQAKFNLVMCTNVLLYYEKDYRKEMVRKLVETVKPGGYLFLEAVGTKFMADLGFVRTNPGSGFYRKN